MSSLTPDILVTAIYFTLTLLVVEALRCATHFLFNRTPLLEQCLQESLAAFELCAICHEITIPLESPHGVWFYGAFLFLASVWWSLTWENATAAPYTYFVNWILGETSLVAVGMVIASQVVGGMMAYQYYTKPLWSLGYGNMHLEKISSDSSICQSDIQASVIVAAIVEGAGVLICILTSKITASTLSSSFSTAIESFVSTMLVIAAMNVSGGYYNPVLATASLWGCFGSTPMEHFLVYWVAETLGAVLAQVLWERSAKIFTEPKPKSD